MSELIRNWLVGITGASMLLAIAESMVPEGNGRKIVNLAGSLVLVLVAIGPIANFDVGLLTEEMKMFESEVQNRSEELTVKEDFLYENIIEEKTVTYILDKASELGIYCEASVSVAWDEDGPAPHSVVIKGSCDHDQYLALSELIEMELGIPRALQRFEEAG